ALMRPSAALGEPYPPQPSYGSTAASEVTLRIRAVGARIGRASWTSESGAITFTSYTWRSTSSGYALSGGCGLGPRTLALFTITSIGPPTASISARPWTG